MDIVQKMFCVIVSSLFNLFQLLCSCSEIPQELVHAAKGGEIDIDIQDKRTEAYVRPKLKLVAFSGEGRKLGG